MQSGRDTNTYVGISIGDGHICGNSILAKLAWGTSYGEQEIEKIFFGISKNNERLIFPEYSELIKNRFLHMLNNWDKLTIQTDDNCGERTIVRFNIKGTHHMNTIETNPDGYSYTTYSHVKSNSE